MPHHEPQHPLLRVITVPREPLVRDQTLFYPSNAKFWRGNSVNHFNFPWSHPVWISSLPTEITKHPIRVLKLGWSCASISLICQTLSSLRVKNTSALFTTVSSEPQSGQRLVPIDNTQNKSCHLPWAVKMRKRQSFSHFMSPGFSVLICEKHSLN